MKQAYQNGEQYFHKLYILFNAFIAISLLPMAWLLLEKQAGQLIPMTLDTTMAWLLNGCLFIGTATIVYYSHNRFKQAKIQSAALTRMREKLDSYRSASIKKYFEFMLASLLCVTGMWLTGSNLFLVGYLICLILLSLSRPTVSTFIEDLKLNEEEAAILLEKRHIQ